MVTKHGILCFYAILMQYKSKHGNEISRRSLLTMQNLRGYGQPTTCSICYISHILQKHCHVPSRH